MKGGVGGSSAITIVPFAVKKLIIRTGKNIILKILLIIPNIPFTFHQNFSDGVIPLEVVAYCTVHPLLLCGGELYDRFRIPVELFCIRDSLKIFPWLICYVSLLVCQ